jgi:hypothetical protein
MLIRLQWDVPCATVPCYSVLPQAHSHAIDSVLWQCLTVCFGSSKKK